MPVSSRILKKGFNQPGSGYIHKPQAQHRTRTTEYVNYDVESMKRRVNPCRIRRKEEPSPNAKRNRIVTPPAIVTDYKTFTSSLLMRNLRRDGLSVACRRIGPAPFRRGLRTRGNH